MSPWQGLHGRSSYLSGSSGTVQIPSGASILQIVAHCTTGPGSIVVFGGASIPLISGQQLALAFRHVNFQAQGAAAQASTEIVFTGTDSYFVEIVQPGGG